jgi:hypothetical protein
MRPKKNHGNKKQRSQRSQVPSSSRYSGTLNPDMSRIPHIYPSLLGMAFTMSKFTDCCGGKVAVDELVTALLQPLSVCVAPGFAKHLTL